MRKQKIKIKGHLKVRVTSFRLVNNIDFELCFSISLKSQNHWLFSGYPSLLSGPLFEHYYFRKCRHPDENWLLPTFDAAWRKYLRTEMRFLEKEGDLKEGEQLPALLMCTTEIDNMYTDMFLQRQAYESVSSDRIDDAARMNLMFIPICANESVEVTRQPDYIKKIVPCYIIRKVPQSDRSYFFTVCFVFFIFTL